MSDFYAALFEHSPDAILVADNDRRYCGANPAACTLLGLSREQIQNCRIDDFAAPALREHIQAAWDEFLRTGSQSGEYELIRPDGSVRRVEFHAAANFVSGLHVSLLRDVTERRRAESETEERFRLTFEQAAVGMSYADLSGRFTRVNSKLADFLGYSVEELLRLNYRDVTHPEDLPANVRDIDALVGAERDVFSREKRYLRKDGTIVWGKISLSLLRRSDGTPAYTFAVIEDISDRKRTEEEVRISRERLDLAMAAAHAGSFDWDLLNNVNQWSPELQHVCGVRQGEFDGSYRSWLALIVPDDRPAMAVAVQQALQTGDFQAEYRIRRPNDGQVRWVGARARVLSDHLGRPARILGIIGDITARKEAEEALRRSHDELEMQVETRTAALRSLSSHLLRAQDDERRRIARELHDSLGQYLAALKMNLDLVDTSKPVSPSLLDEMRMVAQQSLNETRTLSHLLHPPLLDEAGLASAASWYIAGFAQRSGVKIDVRIAPDLPRLPIRVETVLFRILQESLTNIHRHSGSSTADIALTLSQREVHLQVKDTGRGIPPEVLQRFQATGTGYGIGLAGMRERVGELGGDLRITSASSGTTIAVSLPVGELELRLPRPTEHISAA